jgi:hypothetical protein
MWLSEEFIANGARIRSVLAIAREFLRGARAVTFAEKRRVEEPLPRQSRFSLLLAKEKPMSTEGRASNLISSDKESGKAVYGDNNKKIGSIEHVMIDKPSGEIAYAVLSFGGFLGIGTDHYPVPWKALRYDTDLGGYRSDINENRLKGAPKHGTTTTTTMK